MSFTFNPASIRRGRGHINHYKDVTGKAFDWGVTRNLLRYVSPYKREMVGGLLAMLISSGMALLAPYLTKRTIDAYIATGDLVGLSWMALLTFAVYALDFVVTRWRQLVLGTLGNRVLRTMRGELFRHYQTLSMSYFDKHGTGSLISRMLSDVGVINELLSQGIITMFSDIVMLLSIGAVMLLMNPRLALLTLSVLPLVIITSWLFGRRARTAYRQTREKVSALTGRLAEDLGAMRVIQAFAGEERTSRNFDDVNRQNRDANLAAVTLNASITPVMEVLSVLATCIILWFGGQAASRGELTLGSLVAFLSYSARLFQPILDLSMVFNTWQAAMAGGERVQEILDLEPDIQDDPDAIALPLASGHPRPVGHIVFDRVSFHYLTETPILHEISFVVEPGETVALVGPTGAGKTTVARLLMRFYEICEGAICIDGVDIRRIRLSSLRQQLGVVTQEPFLFQGSIAYNIAFGHPDASIEGIIRAAKAANAHDFIKELPDGYDTEILEGSSNLSLGQRQLICLARAALASPSILILDEATSSVDLSTEALIQEAMNELLGGRSSLVIAHRLATVQQADKILVIDDGRIVERGDHESLLALDGVYAHLYRTQFLAPETA